MYKMQSFHNYLYIFILFISFLPARASALEKVVVDFSVDKGPVTYRGSGFLHGFGMGETPFEKVASLKPQAIATHYNSWSAAYPDGIVDVYEYARSIGVKYIQLRVCEWCGHNSDPNVPWPGDYGNWESWENCVGKLVQDILDRGWEVQWDIWNEPQPSGFWQASGGTEQYLETWRRGVVKIRSLDPNADIMGPSSAGFNLAFMQQFLQFCKKHDVLPNILAWHDASRFSDNVNFMRKYLKEEGIDIQRFAIPEYTGPANSNNAGYSAIAFADLERAGVESACRTVNMDPNTDAHIAIHHTLGGLLFPRTFEPRAAWWVYKRYAEMTGELKGLSPSMTVDGLAAWDSEARQATILLGRSAPETVTPGIKIVCQQMNVLSSLIQDGQVRVIAQRIPNSGWGTLAQPEVVMDMNIPLHNNTLEFDIAPFGPSDAYWLIVREPSEECAMIKPVVLTKMESEKVSYYSPPASNLKMDGKLEDWENVPFISLEQQGKVKIWLYKGLEDLSGQFALTWDEKNFYFGARILDDELFQKEPGEQMYNDDSIQFAIYQGESGTGWYEIGLGSEDSVPMIHCWISPLVGQKNSFSDSRLVIQRQGKETIYEAAIPWKELAPISPQNKPFRFSLVVNDNDGSGREGWIEWGEGIAEDKAVSKFRCCEFVLPQK